MDYGQKSQELSRQYQGKLDITSPLSLKDRDDLATLYTPGVAAVSELVLADQKAAYTHTIKGKTVAVVTDGTAVLGLGNIGPEAALPVMEGKALLLKRLAGIDAFPLCLDTNSPEDFIQTVRSLAPTFAGINLEDIAAPACFEIEAALQDLEIPVFHDDQHGTAIVVLAALINAFKVVGKDMNQAHVVVSGVGAAGSAIVKLLACAGQTGGSCQPFGRVTAVDSKGIIQEDRDDLDKYKQEIARLTNSPDVGDLATALKEADAFVGVSVGGIVTAQMVRSMATDPIVFAMANPEPEIGREAALEAGARVVATGASDDPHQVNNVLAFPGIFKGALEARANRITDTMKQAAAVALAGLVSDPEAALLPSPFDSAVVEVVAEAVRKETQSSQES